MQVTTHLFPSRALLHGLATLVLSIAIAVHAADNPLVGLWEPAAEQPNQEIARRVDQLGHLEFTPTHLTAFGESPVPYEYEQDGPVFRIKTDAPRSEPIDFVLHDPNTLLMRLPNDVDIVWKRAEVAATEAPADTSTAMVGGVESAVGDMTFEMLSMMMPHSLPTRYEALGKSLEALLNEGWSITHGSGSGAAMALVLKRERQNVVCILFANMQDQQTGRSDCRRIN